MKYIRDKEGLKHFGERIKKLRKQQKITQAQLGFEANIPRMQVNRIEKGEINTGLSTIIALSNALHISLKDLFDF